MTHTWRDRTLVPPSVYRLQHPVVWGPEGSAVAFFGKTSLTSDSLLLHSETDMLLSVIGTADDGGVLLRPIYKNPMWLIQRIVCWILGIQDVRANPPCLERGGVIVYIGEAYIEQHGEPDK